MAARSILEERAAFERRAQRSAGAPGVVIVDVLNVTLGATMGELLPMIVERIRPVLRDDDEIARVGNDQLGVCIDVEGVDIRSICDRIEEVVEARPFLLESNQVRIRVTATGATVAEAGGVGALALAYERNSARVQARHRQLYHEGSFNTGRGGASVTTFEEWATIVIDNLITGFDCTKAEYSFDGDTWTRGVETGVIKLDLPISVAEAVRGRFRAWSLEPTPLEPGFLTSFSAYLDEVAERLVMLVAAHTDPLTTCRNRAGLAAALAHRAPTSVAILDIDHFKSINDRFGHDAGDEALSGIGRRLVAQCDPAVVARWGGEEFVVASDESSADLALVLNRLLESCPSDADGHPITFSAGVAPVTDGWKRAVTVADRLLMEAKKTRARVVVAPA